jgi:NADH-quinone oxidoreductase subunit A
VSDYLVVGAFLVLGVLFVIATLGISRLLAPSKLSPEKLATYECGSEPIGPPWVQFHIGYYLYALLFVMFDIETVFMYPWAVAFRRMGVFILVEMAVFLGIIGVGLAYAWKEGALKWR